MSNASSQTTVDINVIKEWTEKRGGKPAIVKSTHDEEGSGVLRIDFPGFSGEGSLEEVPWEEWYEVFIERKLAFLYQDQTSEGKESRFFKLVSAEK